MTLKEKRYAQLDSLKETSVSPVKFCLEILNSAFMPWKVYTFDTLEELQEQYEKLEPVHYAAFLRKYAKVSIR